MAGKQQATAKLHYFQYRGSPVMIIRSFIPKGNLPAQGTGIVCACALFKTYQHRRQVAGF
jgi:hypothetical protein